MAITATTLSAAAGISDLVVVVASATGITAPNFTAGTGITLLQINQEYFLVTGVSGTTVSVQRGYNGSPAQAHTSGDAVYIGTTSDFPYASEVLSTSTTTKQTEGIVTWNAINLVGLTDAIPATGGFYVVKTSTAPDVMTLAAPAVSSEGVLLSIISDTTCAHTITATSLLAAGTALKTTATFAAFRGAGLVLRACNGVWQVLASQVVTLS
jgi:hypothetical protein